MGFLNEFLLGDLPHAVQMGAVTAGHRRHVSPTNLRDKENLRMKHSIHNLHFTCVL